MQLRRHIGLLISLIGLVAIGLLGFGTAASAQQVNPTMTVNDTGDSDDADTSDGVCQTSSGTCTLRAAISQANNNLGPDTINFNIPGGGVHTIGLGSALPPINDPSGGVTIDGYTQPGSTTNTDPLLFNANILIEIDTNSVDHAFTIQSAENTLRGLAIFDADIAIELINENADGNVIVGNIIGSDSTTTYSRGGGIGIIMNTGPDQNVVGSPALEDRNIISGNGSYGIRINHGETSQNLIQNNIIGMDRTGTTALPHSIGIDLQWWTWGNLVGGNGQYESNLISGNGSGLDFSHMATGNNAIGNRIGTFVDGVTYSSVSGNGRGVIFKDDAKGNYIADNIIRGNDSDGVWNKQNYTGQNTFVNNEITANGRYGAYVTGHDDVFFNNIFANNVTGAININNVSSRNNANSPDQLTERTSVRLGHIYDNGGPFILMGDDEAHPSADQASITGVGPGAVYGGDTCNGCTVDIYVSGSVNGDGTVTPGPSATDWMALVATHSGQCVDITSNSNSAGADLIQDGCDLDSGQQFNLVGDGDGFTLRPNSSGLCVDVPGASTSNNVIVEQHTCNGGDNQRLQWSGNSLVFAHSGKCLEVQNASQSTGAKLIQTTCDGSDEQRFHPGTTINSTWLGSVTADSNGDFSMASSALTEGVVVWAIATTPDGESAVASGHTMVVGAGYGLGSNPASPLPTPSTPVGPAFPEPYQPSVFGCGENSGTLSWTDAGANEYYVFATTAGTESYLGGHQGTSLGVAGADSYRVTHWLGGFPTTALCDGPGPAAPEVFSCNANGTLLSWTDEGASTYYVRMVIDGVETFVGGYQGTSATVPGADSYKVIHWLNGRTEATCDGPGPGQGGGFSCSASGGILSWSDAGASTYYVRSITAGVETFVGGFEGTTSTPIAGADSYKVIHWLDGKTEATCDGPGPDQAFSCSVSGSTLSWSDAGASTYYIRTVTGGVDTYFGGFQGTSATVPAADSYLVIHWLDGKTEASCAP